ncbi:MAG: hypothetical protein C4540_04595 [Candidatus Omnitrophota bacterium]|nr:MAG: hypothetical protein C4540_04595 [Candidatus Omnitrophota bacterium]
MKKLSIIEKLLSLFLCVMLVTSAFALEIKQNSITPIAILLVNSTDGYTGTVGVTSPIVYYSKAGGEAINLTSPEWTEINATNMPGLYRLNTTSVMTDTEGELIVYVDKAGVRTFRKTIDIVSKLESDSYAIINNATFGLEAIKNDTGIINGTVTSINGTSVAIKAQTDKIQFDASNYTKSTPQTGVTVTTNNDKTGYTLSQSFPGNFSSLLITSAGKVTVGTNDDKTGYTASTVSDKAGYSLSGAQAFNLTGNITGNLSGSIGSLSAAAIQSIWDALTSALTTAGSIGKKLADWVLGTDNKVILSNNAHTGAVIPLVTNITNKTGVTLDSGEYTNIWNKDISGYSGAGYAGTYLKGLWDKKPAGNMTSDTTWNATKAGYLDAAVSSRSTLGASDVWGYATRTLTQSINATIGAGDIANITGGVWNATMASYNGTGTMGNKMNVLPTSGTGDWGEAEKVAIKGALGIINNATTSTLQQIGNYTNGEKEAGNYTGIERMIRIQR